MPRDRESESAGHVAAERAARADEPAMLAPVLAADPLDLRVSLAAIVHWADSHELRVRVMKDVAFPVDDLPMFLTVNQLSYRGAMRPTDLALTLGTGKANMSKIAKRLQDSGLVVRVPATDDERSTLIALTPAGRQIGERIMRHAQESLDATVADWSAEDLQTLRAMLARLARGAIGDRWLGLDQRDDQRDDRQ